MWERIEKKIRKESDAREPLESYLALVLKSGTPRANSGRVASLPNNQWSQLELTRRAGEGKNNGGKKRTGKRGKGRNFLPFPTQKLLEVQRRGRGGRKGNSWME